MIDDQDGATAQTIRRAEIARLLKKYPDMDHDEQTTLIRWFKREATALDVAMLSSIDDLRPAYSAFRKDHLDRVSAMSLLLISSALMIGFGGLIWAYW